MPKTLRQMAGTGTADLHRIEIVALSDRFCQIAATVDEIP